MTRTYPRSRDADWSVSTTPRTGQFTGVEVFTNRDGEGVFTRRADGSYQQHIGTSQTPGFRSATQLAAWLRRNFPSYY